MKKESLSLTIFKKLRKVRGLIPLAYLNEAHKNIIKKLEDKNNLGVFESLNRDYTLLVLHNSMFRKPSGEIVEDYNDKIIFPVVPFHEINQITKRAVNVTSSSPSENVHNKLVKELKLTLKEDEASLLVGFDLK